MPSRRMNALLFAVALAASPVSRATTKGLNQIVTPEIQPEGMLSVSAQYQSPVIGNKEETQLEYGVAPQFEVAVFQGFSPSEEILGTELGLIERGSYLLSTGFINLSSRTSQDQPFLEGGYYPGKDHFILGVLRANPEYQAIVGYARVLNDRLQFSVDYQGGGSNFRTAGFTYNFTPNLSLNPAIYFTNDSPHRRYGYAVLSYNIPLGQKSRA